VESGLAVKNYFAANPELLSLIASLVEKIMGSQGNYLRETCSGEVLMNLT